jgi:hypothetical protein
VERYSSGPSAQRTNLIRRQTRELLLAQHYRIAKENLSTTTVCGERYSGPALMTFMRELLAIVLTVLALTTAAMAFATLTYSPAVADCDDRCD